MKLVIPGGSGQVGSVLARAFHADGHEVVLLSRTAPPAGAASPRAPWRIRTWDAQTLGDWAEELEGADIVINLAGRSVNCRYTARNRRLIKDSRVNSTRVVGAAIARARRPPRIWMQASTATIYAHRYDAPNNEATGILGGNEADAPETWRFSIDVAKAWEQAANEAIVPSTRKVLLRSAMIMSPDRAGVFDTLVALVRRGLGGQAADGKQYVSWIHDLDFVRAIRWIIEHEELAGAVNACSPGPLPNAQFMRALREAWGARFGLPATKGMLEIAAMLIRTETELVLKSRRVVPRRLLETGFDFQFPARPPAAVDLCRRWSEAREPATSAGVGDNCASGASAAPGPLVGKSDPG